MAIVYLIFKKKKKHDERSSFCYFQFIQNIKYNIYQVRLFFDFYLPQFFCHLLYKN